MRQSTMQPARNPENEALRIAAQQALDVLDTGTEPVFEGRQGMPEVMQISSELQMGEAAIRRMYAATPG